MPSIFDQLSDAQEIERQRRQAAEDELRGGVERIIDAAQRKGMFDNLPGKGKPLRLNKNPYAQEQALAFELLQNNDYTLPWIDKRGELLGQIAAFRAELERDWRKHKARLVVAVGIEQDELRRAWLADLPARRAQVAKLNRKISDLNLAIPVSRLELLQLKLEQELARIGAPAAP